MPASSSAAIVVAIKLATGEGGEEGVEGVRVEAAAAGSGAKRYKLLPKTFKLQLPGKTCRQPVQNRERERQGVCGRESELEEAIETAAFTLPKKV